jgi:formate hydrogenlyase subunit 3/multisubunit Na+/H+ antiporter MnhD subunit
MILAASGYAMIIGIMLFYMITGSFEIEEVIAGLRGVTGIIVPLSLGLFLIGPIGKAASIPLHTWFPDAAQVAPTPAIGMLPAAIEKLMGIYALTRVCWYMFEIGLSWRLGLAILGAITMVIAVMMALAQNDAKRLVAYGSITQVGYMIMSIALGTSLAVAAGLFHLINCMVYSACLFLAVGAVQYMTGTKDMEKLGGLSKKMPITAAIFVIAALTISGIPPFSAFASKWMIYQAAITADSGFAIFAVVAMIVSALTLAVFIKAIHSIFYGRMPESLEKMEIKEVPKTMTVSMGILAAICIIFGILPQIPLNYFVIPGLESLGFMMDPTVMAYPISTNMGTWASAPATIMLIAALLIGAIIYWISSKGVTTGEPVTTYACGEDPSPDTISVTSDNLYSPIKTIFSRAYNVGMRGGFDIAYNAIARFVVGFSQRFRGSQSGMLRTYIGWLVIFLSVMSLMIMMLIRMGMGVI